MPNTPEVNDFINAYLKLKTTQEAIVSEDSFHAEDEAYAARKSELKGLREEALKALNTAFIEEDSSDETLALAAVQEAHAAKKEMERERAACVSQRENVLQRNTRLREEVDLQLKVCVGRLLQLSPCFKKIIVPSWLPEERDIDLTVLDTADELVQQSEASGGENERQQQTCTVNDVQRLVTPPPTSGGRLSESMLEPNEDPFAGSSDHGSVVEPRTFSASSETLIGDQLQGIESGHSFTPRKRKRDDQQPAGADRASTNNLTQGTAKRATRKKRRKQSEMGREDPIRKQLKRNVLVAIKSINMTELANSKHRHYIHKEKDEFYIFRCDVCGVHFGKNPLAGATGHLSKPRQHYSLKQSECAGRSINRNDALRFMGIKVMGCDEPAMEAHNEAVNQLGDSYIVRGALSSDSREHREMRYHPEHPMVLLPRDQEKNRPRWIDEAQSPSELSSSAGTIPANSSNIRPAPSRVQSDVPKPSTNERVIGCVPGQIYWTKEGTYERYRPAMALPYHNLTEIGLPDYDVSDWINRMSIKYTFHEDTGYFHDDRLSYRHITEGEKVYPLLYLDGSDEQANPKVTYGRLSWIRPFARDDVPEGDAAFRKLFQYLDEDHLWFMTAGAAQHANEESVSPRNDQRTPRKEKNSAIPINISDDEENSDTNDELPSLTAIMKATPPKPPSAAATVESNGRGREVRSRLASTLASNVSNVGVPSRLGDGTEVGESSRAAPMAVME